MKHIGLYILLLIVIFCSSVIVKGSEAEFTVSLGETNNDFNYSRKGVLTYKGKRFTPALAVNIKNVTEFKISMPEQKNWAGAIPVDQYGQNTVFFLDVAKMTATPMQKRGQWNAAQKIYWSPSGRYMVALCAYEGESFVRIDTKTKSVGDAGVSYTQPGSNYETMLSITDEPKCSGSRDVLIFNVKKRCNPYELANCDPDRVIARYKVSLNAATLKLTYGK